MPSQGAVAAGQIKLTADQADAIRCALHYTTAAEADDIRSTARDAASGLLAADDPKLNAMVREGIIRLNRCGLSLEDPLLMKVYSAYTQLLLGAGNKLKP